MTSCRFAAPIAFALMVQASPSEDRPGDWARLDPPCALSWETSAGRTMLVAGCPRRRSTSPLARSAAADASSPFRYAPVEPDVERAIPPRGLGSGPQPSHAALQGGDARRCCGRSTRPSTREGLLEYACQALCAAATVCGAGRRLGASALEADARRPLVMRQTHLAPARRRAAVPARTTPLDKTSHRARRQPRDLVEPCKHIAALS